jgi:hypothetical protein
MRASRGMGDIASSKMPKGVKKARRDNTNFTAYAKGGSVRLGKPSVEEAVKKAAKGYKGNVVGSSAKPSIRKRGYRG